MGIIKRMALLTGRFTGDPEERDEGLFRAPEDIEERRGLSFSSCGSSLPVDIYRRKDAQGRLPVILLYHGGGLTVGHPLAERPACISLAEKGYLVYAPGYRMITETDAMGEISDICASFDFALDTLEAYGGDPERVYVIAESAAAFLCEYAIALRSSEELCEVTGCSPSKLDIKAAAFVSGMFYTARRDIIGLTYPADLYGSRKRDPEFMKLMDPEDPEVAGNLPPSIFTTSRNDFLRKYSFLYYGALKKAGGDCRLLYYAEKNKKLVHAFVTLWPGLPESRDALDKIDKWFRGHDK